MIFFVGILVYGIMALSGVNIYYVTYILGDSKLMGRFMMIYFASTIIGMVFMTPFVKKIGKRNTVFIGFLCYLIGTLIIAFEPYNINQVLVGIFIKGLGLAPIVGSLPSFIADTIEFGEWKSGLRTEGLVFSAESFGQKLGNGFAIALLGWTLTINGYVGGNAVQTGSAVSTIIALFTVIPLVLYLIAALILIFYKLDKEYASVIEELHS